MICHWLVFLAWKCSSNKGAGKPTQWACFGTKPSDVWLPGDPEGIIALLWCIPLNPIWSTCFSLGRVSKCNYYAGNRSCWFRPEDKNGCWAWWSCYSLCTWPKWEPCYSEMHRVYSSGRNSLYHFNLLWSNCDLVYSSIWLPGCTGLAILFQMVALMFARYISMCIVLTRNNFLWLTREYWSTVIVLKLSRLWWKKLCNVFACWHKTNMGTMSSRYAIFASCLFFEYFILFTPFVTFFAQTDYGYFVLSCHFHILYHSFSSPKFGNFLCNSMYWSMESLMSDLLSLRSYLVRLFIWVNRNLLQILLRNA